MKIQINKDNYIVGYATKGGLNDGIDVEYDSSIFTYGFEFYKYENGNIIFDANKYDLFIKNKEKQKRIDETQSKINEISEWLKNYDLEYSSYERCKRLGIIYHKDIDLLNAEAAEKQKQYNELNKQIEEMTIE